MGSSVGLHVANHIEVWQKCSERKWIHLGKTRTSISHFYALCCFVLYIRANQLLSESSKSKTEEDREGWRQEKEEDKGTCCELVVFTTLWTPERCFTYVVAFFSHHALSLFVTLWTTSRANLTIVGNTVNIKYELKVEVCEKWSSVVSACTKTVIRIFVLPNCYTVSLPVSQG